ncbi:flagellar transcriptional regulator FlhC [Pseudomonas putida]|uniref:Flagellar transcriptional regulator FlhC n=1 Tax=Pseudomonas putida TaxID=303 RepID=A0A8I1JIH8_PSEPU|nr:flagellar transcriptional regulator FlhC [Pseudomonas putida]MBI6882534.1 flagellar transcriptional regulator FlhC [Pseudomonas putida]
MPIKKSLLDEMAQVQLAIDLMEMGARLQVVENETEISRPRLIKLYKEVVGISPPKGLLPFSTDWFMTWMPNIHSSLFYTIYQRVAEDGGDDSKITLFTRAFRLYQEQVEADESELVLSLTRAWTLVRFFDSKMLEMVSCTKCTCHFVAHAYTPNANYVCGICLPPSRAGKTKRSTVPDEPFATCVANTLDLAGYESNQQKNSC